jgi:hypothetical protein
MFLRCQERDRDRVISLEESRNPACLKRESDAPAALAHARAAAAHSQGGAGPAGGVLGGSAPGTGVPQLPEGIPAEVVAAMQGLPG